MKYKWRLPKAITPEQQQLAQKMNISPVLGQILSNRGFSTEEKIAHLLYSPVPDQNHSPGMLKDLQKAVHRIIQALNSKEKIVIYGDYDVDGITSTALLYQFFQVYAFYNKTDVDVISVLPERVFEGYGLKLSGIKKAIGLGANLIITVDNGTSANEAIGYANKNKIDVIVIDHHSAPDILPDAFAIVNPKQKQCQYPYKHLSAVGLVYKVTEALSDELLEDAAKKRFLDRYLDLVALGTYQDVAPLIGENRYYVKKGIGIIDALKKNNKTNLKGIIELLKAAEKYDELIDYHTIGYCLGPMINASGRIDTPEKAFKLLTTTNAEEARTIALELKVINDKRKLMTKLAYEEAQEIIKKNNLLEDKVVILQSNDWHQGIIGLVAQLVTSSYHKNCLVMTNKDKEYYTGSARSCDDFDIGGLIRSLGQYCIYFGGHRKAAGFSIYEDRIADFKNALHEEMQTRPIPDPEIVIEAEINIKDINQNFLDDMNQFEPFGEANPEPMFGIFKARINDLRESKRGLDTLLKVSQNNSNLFLVAFNNTHYINDYKKSDLVDLAVKISGNNIKRNFLVEIVDMRKFELTNT